MDATPQHKRMAMGQKVTGMKSGGPVMPSMPMAQSARKTGIPDSPITKVKAANGIPGMKKGGKC